MASVSTSSDIVSSIMSRIDGTKNKANVALWMKRYRAAMVKFLRAVTSVLLLLIPLTLLLLLLLLQLVFLLLLQALL